MSDYNWCHGTNCHKQETQSRIRGSGDNKVLRTRRVKVYTGRSMFGNGGGTIWDYFCNHQCLMDYLAYHTQAIVDIAPRREPLETPIKVKTEKYESYKYNYKTNQREAYQATRKIIRGINE